jgi:hypothetical protein
MGREPKIASVPSRIFKFRLMQGCVAMAILFNKTMRLSATATVLSLLTVMPLHAQSTVTGDPSASDEEAAKLDGVGAQHSGILQINQSSADGAQQANLLSVAAVSSEGAALSDSAVSQQTRDTVYGSVSDVRGVTISNAGTESVGLVAINQSAAEGMSQINNASIAKASGAGSIAFAAAHSGSGTQGAAYSSAAGLYGAGPATLSGTGNGSTGIFTVNQAASVGGDQTNLIAVAVSRDGLANATGTTSSKRAGGPADYAGSSAGAVSIAGSFNAAAGVVQINQASGGFNTQANILAIAIGQYGDATAISDTGLSEIGPQSEAAALQPARQAADAGTVGSFDGFTGIAQVSQVSGYGNAVTNSMTVSLSHIPAAGL